MNANKKTPKRGERCTTGLVVLATLARSKRDDGNVWRALRVF
jgi:hypothetical protein